jgi:hypothetical protein
MHDIDLIRAYRQDVTDDHAAETAARERLRAHMAATPTRASGVPGVRRRLRKLRRRLGVSLAAVLVICSSATAAKLLLTSDDLDLGSVACLDTARTLAASTGRASFVEPTGDPVAACAKRWRTGGVDGRRHDVAPDLVACASAGQPVIVVPGTPRTCGELHLELLPHDYAAAASATGRAKAVLQRDADLHLPLSRCDDPRTILSRARQLLADAGVHDFPVKLTGNGPCAGVLLFDGGAAARVELLSRTDAGDYYEHRLVGAALEPLFAEGRAPCQDPLHATDRARRLLRDAGLPEVTVRVEPHGGRCLAPGYVVGHHEVVLDRQPQEP